MCGRCISCDSKLTESEMKRKHSETGEYMDMCSSCLREVMEIVEIPIDGEPVFPVEYDDLVEQGDQE